MEASLHAEQTRKDLARTVTSLFDKWGLEGEQQAQLLGMPGNGPEACAEYRAGQQALPDEPETLDRVGYLLGIHAGLRLLFPEDEAIRFGWVKMRNQSLDGRTPLDVMLSEGLVGVARVARLVDFQGGR
ncbi:MbcA/ParS/Xre antitoxin family protein [Novilysobacter defluvii]|uniref:Antitoxin Xre/MbcA/ParS-like toxin-binding domain-containing protein n=1 Tax=Lysobacter defluvii IMMIB APB-9 = DSM 18482 TaxID=1385515 RepID=A0A0A0M9H8_9GAMM|nr:MbcA/ParS/Xre antitoxin family protein [Lysobacter defluvii]KGO99725.1 hypothetical protein N791_07665 [Lysobacter defluvii IMMIB APB-9 = DSM 18482]